MTNNLILHYYSDEGVEADEFEVNATSESERITCQRWRNIPNRSGVGHEVYEHGWDISEIMIIIYYISIHKSEAALLEAPNIVSHRLASSTMKVYMSVS